MICLKLILILKYLVLGKKIYETKDKNKNNKLVKLIKNRWSDLKDKIEEMSEDEKKLKNEMKY